MNIKSGESSHGERTREQILCAAEELFAEKGFSQTSIRDITEKAECNLAAVNYYFHGKENLYSEVFRLHMNTVRDLRINAVRNFLSDSSDPKTLEALLQIFATTFLEPFLKKGSGQKLMELMMRERYDPHLPPQMFTEEIIQPTKTVMKEALAQISPGLSDTAAVDTLKRELLQCVAIRPLARRGFCFLDHFAAQVNGDVLDGQV